VVSLLFPEDVHSFAKLFEKSWYAACTPPSLSAYLAIHVNAHTESEEIFIPAVLQDVAPRQMGWQGG